MEKIKTTEKVIGENYVILGEWDKYFLVKFIESDIEIMISYLDYNF